MTQVQSPTTLEVQLGDRSYPISIGQSLLSSDLPARFVRGKHAAVVTNTVVAPLYLERVTASLRGAGKEVTTVILSDGEEEKNWASLMQVFDALLSAKCDRKTTLVALGGGVIGDLTGFAAASYMRGVPFVQIPTTLLAQVDSSVGGKTGINHPLGKNMIGAFYQPNAVIDIAFFDWIETNIGRLSAREPDALAYAIRRSCEIKAEVVRQDEREGGLRAILNFGHTFGHAIEAGMGYGEWLHGEAVGCGMVMAAELSHRLGYLDSEARERIEALVAAAGLPTRAPDLGLARWVELMQVDKKNEGGQIKFILPKPLGQAIITPVPAEMLQATIEMCVAR